jgi:exosome complex component RRP42
MIKVPESERFFIDATPQEELACPDRLHAWFSQDGKVCGIRLEGESGIEADRIKPLLIVSRQRGMCGKIKLIG